MKKPNREKPKTTKAQVAALWDLTHNHVLTRLAYLDWQIKFLIVLVLGLLGVILARSL